MINLVYVLEGKTRKNSCWVWRWAVRESEKSVMTPGFLFEWLEWWFPLLTCFNSRCWAYEWYLIPFKVLLPPQTTFFTFIYLFYWHIVDTQCYCVFGGTTQWFDRSMCYAVLTTSVAAICHHTTLLQYHWLYSLWCVFVPMTYSFNN